ncbi:hypothetical protein F442_02476, partial [Phytophthora nicotianae P10297]
WLRHIFDFPRFGCNATPNAFPATNPTIPTNAATLRKTTAPPTVVLDSVPPQQRCVGSMWPRCRFKAWWTDNAFETSFAACC